MEDGKKTAIRKGNSEEEEPLPICPRRVAAQRPSKLFAIVRTRIRAQT